MKPIAPLRRGRFISLEGIEGAGKSTVAQALSAELERRGEPVVLTREPGGTPLAEELRTLLLRRSGEPISAIAESLLMFAARAAHVDQVIRPAMLKGQWVICDRFTDASYAYQGAGRGVRETLLDELATAVHGDLWPTRTLLLDLPVATGLARARLRRGEPDRFEAETVEFFERARAAYLRRAALESGRVRLIDATPEAPVVCAAALAALADLLPP